MAGALLKGSKVLREYHITEGKVQSGGGRGRKIIADYILVHKGIKLAVIEAKSSLCDVDEAVGILTRWPAVRQILMTVVIFLFLLALSNLGATLFSDETQEFSDTGSLIRTIVRLALLPFIFFYLRTEKVKKYFERKSRF